MTQGAPASSWCIVRDQPSSGMIRRSAPMPNRSLNSLASSPIVMPWRRGIGNCPTKEVKSGSRTGPSTASPPIGLGRSHTTTGNPHRRAARRQLASV